MAQSGAFCTLANGAKFSVQGFHAKEDGTALVLTKLSDTQAKDDTGRVWDFSQCQGLICDSR